MNESSFNYFCSHDTVCKMYLQMSVTKTFIVAKKHVMPREKIFPNNIVMFVSQKFSSGSCFFLSRILK